MSHIRSITLATENIDKTIDLFHNVLGMTYQKRITLFNLVMQLLIQEQEYNLLK